MSSWGLLDDKTEAELHKTRLLNVEEKPFRRITKRLATISSFVSSQPDSRGDDGVVSSDGNTASLREDLTLDFAAFDSNIARLQFLNDANQRERERYAADQQRILAECQAVRASNAQLRDQLEGARATLAQRKKFDDLAEKITSNRLLRPREDQLANLKKLDEECKELERESSTYSATWKLRREQFNKIMDEGRELRRQIRDEKEEVDRREGMNEGGEDDVDGDRANEPSGDATPRPDAGDSQGKAAESSETPQQIASTDDRTPSGDTPAPDSLRPASAHLSTLSRNGSQVPSRDVSPAPPQKEGDEVAKGDVDMEDEGAPDSAADGREAAGANTPQNSADKMDVDN